MEDNISKIQSIENENSRQNSRLRVITYMLVLFCVGELFLFKNLTGSLKKEIKEFKEDVKRNNAEICAELVFEKPIPINLLINYDENSLYQKVNVSPPNITSTDSATIKKYDLKNVKSINIEVNRLDVNIKNPQNVSQQETPSKKEFIYSKNIQAFYYVISKDSRTIKITENLCYAQIRPDRDTTANKDNYLTGISIGSELIITTIDNKEFRSPFSLDKTSKSTLESTWKVVLCDDNNIDKITVLRIKSSLKERQYDVPISERWDDIKPVLYKYQKEQNLPIGYIDFETLRSLGFEIFIGSKTNNDKN